MQMAQNVTLSDATYAKAQSIAKAFVDTPDTAIARALDFYISKNPAAVINASKSTATEVQTSGTIPFPADGPPDLSFTRPIAITLDGEKLDKKSLYWNALLFIVVARAATKLSPDKLRQAILVNFVEGEGNQEIGYRFIPEGNLSVQGQASNAAWKAIIHLIKATGMSINVVFLWESKDKAAYPGKTGQMIHQAA